MSNPKHPGMEVDPSEDAIDEGGEQQGAQAADAGLDEVSMREVDPSETPE